MIQKQYIEFWQEGGQNKRLTQDERRTPQGPSTFGTGLCTSFHQLLDEAPLFSLMMTMLSSSPRTLCRLDKLQVACRRFCGWVDVPIHPLKVLPGSGSVSPLLGVFARIILNPQNKLTRLMGDHRVQGAYKGLTQSLCMLLGFLWNSLQQEQGLSLTLLHTCGTLFLLLGCLAQF